MYLLDYAFTSLLHINDLDLLWSKLKQVILDAVSLFVPKIKIKSSPQPRWFTSEIRHNLNIVHTLRRKHRKNPTSTNCDKLSSAESNLQNLMSKVKSEYEDHLVSSFAHSDSSKIYKYIQSHSRNSTFPPTMYLDTIGTTPDFEKAELFNKYFHSVFSSTTYVLPTISDLPTPACNSTLSNLME